MRKLLMIIPLVFLLCTLLIESKPNHAEEWTAEQKAVAESFQQLIDTAMKGDIEKAIEFADAIYMGISDFDISIEDIMAEWNKVTVRGILRGTHIGDILGIPASGNKIEQSQIVIYRFENGKIVEMREDYDSLGFMQQLGMELKPKEE